MASKGNKRHGSETDRNGANTGPCFKAALQAASGCLVQGKLLPFYTGEGQAGSFLSTETANTLVTLEGTTGGCFLARSNSHPQAGISGG